jgi:rare lipoprotein A (peptidoglycan hydrolase)
MKYFITALLALAMLQLPATAFSRSKHSASHSRHSVSHKKHAVSHRKHASRSRHASRNRHASRSKRASRIKSGTATFYANRFSGRRMANGKIYHPTKMIAAHRRYKLGSRIKVTNRRNGKSVVVTVSDRCHCSLDLSPKAFSHIGRLSQGRVPITVTHLSGS